MLNRQAYIKIRRAKKHIGPCAGVVKRSFGCSAPLSLEPPCSSCDARSREGRKPQHKHEQEQMAMLAECQPDPLELRWADTIHVRA